MTFRSQASGSIRDSRIDAERSTFSIAAFFESLREQITMNDPTKYESGWPGAMKPMVQPAPER
jgi:hypothetical protein